MNFLTDIFFTKVAYAESIDQFISHANALIVNPLIKLLFALALAYFLWGCFEFIMNQDETEGRTNGKNHMIWGIVGMTIMFSLWGILAIVLNTFGITGVNPKNGTVNLNNYNPNYPTLSNPK